MASIKQVLATAFAVFAGASMVFYTSSTAHAAGEWYLAAMKVPQAHTISTGNGVTVAIVEGGVGRHPDIDAHVVAGTSVIGEDERKEAESYEFGSKVYHGTTMAARVLEVAPDAKIMPVQVGIGQFHGSNVAKGIRWATDHGAQVINLSIETNGTQELVDAAQYALDHNVVIVAGTGNEPDFEIEGIASMPGIVATGGFEQGGGIWLEEQRGYGSTKGPQVVLSAPAGSPMRGLIPDNPGVDPGYTPTQSSGGTSSATALTSGAAALVRAKYPDLDTKNVINRLISTAVDVGKAGRDDEYGFGRIDAYAALTADIPEVNKNPLREPKSVRCDYGPCDKATGSGFSLSPLIIVAIVGGAATVALITVIAIALGRRRRI